MLDRRGRALRAALGFLTLPALAGGAEAEVGLLRRWLDSWRGIGAIAVGMAREGYDLQLTKYADQGWRANFYPAGIAHSVVVASAWESTPWRALQGSAWNALSKGSR